MSAPTDTQIVTLRRVASRSYLGGWYRAGTLGEGITLASLHRRDMVERRQREDSPGFEYRVDPTILELAHELFGAPH